MNNRALKDLLSENPDTAIFEALDSQRDHTDILPLLDAELRRSSSRIQRLREYRNALSSPMYRLLPELISKIFFAYAEDSYSLHNLKWTKLLLVCRRWYDIAMCTPELWSFVEFSHAHLGYSQHDIDQLDVLDLRRIDTQISRAGFRPLSLRMELWPQLSETKSLRLPKLLDSQQLLSLSLVGDNSHVSRVLHLLSLHRHDTLESLQIGSESFMTYGSFDGSLPDSVLRDNMPRLKHLWIDFLRFDWAYVHGLRSLHVSYHHGTLPFNYGDILNALARCPLVEDVDLHLPLITLPQTNSPFPSSVPLPYLRSISVRAAAELCTGMMRRFVDLSPNAKVALLTGLFAENITTYPLLSSPLISYLSGRASLSGAPIIRALCLSFTVGFGEPGVFGPVQNFNVMGHACAIRDRRPSIRPKEKPFIEFGATISRDSSTEPIFASVLQSWPLKNIAHVDVRSAREINPSMWFALFAALPSPISVIVRPESGSALSLVDVLRDLTQASQLRVVKNIILDASDFNFPGDHGANEHSPSGEVRARYATIRILLYCADVAREGAPVNTVEVVNDIKGRLLGLRRIQQDGTEINWRELYKDLEEGFIYENILYNSSVGPDGVPVNSFPTRDA